VKARICPWGHRDKEKEWHRSDAPCMSMEIFRLVLSLATEFKWEIGEMDITAAYLQAKGFDRDVYVKPPKEDNSSNVLWLLTAAAYGLTNSGRLWYLTSDHSLTEIFGLSRSTFEPTLYYRNDSNVSEHKRKAFELFGCEIKQDRGSEIILTQTAKMNTIDASKILEASENYEKDELATPQDITKFKSAIGQMLFIGRLSNPVMLYFASHMATKSSALYSHHLKQLGSIIRHVKRQPHNLTFKVPNAKYKSHIEVSRFAWWIHHIPPFWRYHSPHHVAIKKTTSCGKKQQHCRNTRRCSCGRHGYLPTRGHRRTHRR